MSVEASGVGIRGEASCLASGGGELRVERSLWRILREAEIERERGERRAERKVREADEREREKKKGDKMIERREKIIKKLISAYSISGRTVLFLERNCSYVPNVLAFGTPHERGFLVFGVPNAKYLAFGTPDKNALRLLRRRRVSFLLRSYEHGH